MGAPRRSRAADLLQRLSLLALIAVNADQWPDETRLSDLEKLFTCLVCGRKGAEIRPDFWDTEPVRQIGFRAYRGH